MLVQVKDGFISKGNSVVSCAFKKKYDIFEVTNKRIANISRYGFFTVKR